MAKALVIAAPSSGSGKTVVTLGILRALRKSGVRVASAKVGPDYIDPCFHAAASGRPCFNLDPWAMSRERIEAYLQHLGEGTDILVIEGVMGLFDGPQDASASTADLAKALGLPIVLIVDCTAMAQSAGAVAHGFDHSAPLAGLILNRLAGERHERVVRSGISKAHAIFGTVHRSSRLSLPSRHLGLVQAGETQDLEDFIESASDIVGAAIDIEALAQIAVPIPPGSAPPALPPLGQRIAVASDEAFGFVYPHLLYEWRRSGAEIMLFSPLADEAPDPASDAVFLPGGYPELHAARISGNRGFLDGMRAAARRDSLIYGECGGFMALGEYIIDGDGRRHSMTGLLPLGTSFAERRLHLGYRTFRHRSPLPFPAGIRGHEFHYSTIDRQDGDPLFEATDAAGENLGPFGIARGNVMGSYAHIIS